MGYTSNTTTIVRTIIGNYPINSVMDLGSQQNYDQPNLPAPYISEWYKENFGFRQFRWDRPYRCIDLNGENYSDQLDLGQPLPEDYLTGYPSDVYRFSDLVVDAGTSEHVGKDNAFNWEAIYNCWLNKHDLLKVGGIMVNENPKTGNWPGHGYNYYSTEFYQALATVTDYSIIDLFEHPAMENRVDGWNVVCVLRKKSNRFPTLEQFQELGLQPA